MPQSQDYKKTLTMPQTAFDMRAGLPKKEPGILERWKKMDLYGHMLERRAGKPSYILHDGPPYANGDIHTGTALNKILKDMVVKYKSMDGFFAPYVPGWDTHGLPIELKALKKLGVDKNGVPAPVLRQHCREFALGYVNDQREQFIRLGVTGDFEHPYVTLQPEFEAEQVKVFGEMAKKGLIYRGLKPVYWCADCGTALAEAEIEYAEDPCDSIYVKFQVTDDKGIFAAKGVDKAKVYFVIWTTTTWTLPGNLAISLGPDFDYALAKAGDEYYVVAEYLLPGVMKAGGIGDYETVAVFKGSELEYMKAAHPFLPRESLIIVGDHVTLESGTGCVHTAPGFGAEDFAVCQKYGIETIVPVDAEGRQTAEAGPFAGLKTLDSNKPIADALKASGSLFALEKIVHQYPHCWRCKEPVMFRATEQWFCSVDSIKEDAVKAIESVEWVPAWGGERMKAMVEGRTDWCISRQRRWGVPIPILYCKDCGKEIINDTTVSAISELFRQEGSDAWYLKTPDQFLPEGFACPECGCKEFTQEQDILDVWFDSGTTHMGVLEQRENLSWPADLYLEGADQYRGWFQSSLLTAVAMGRPAPYKAVCTHGWVVDGEGRAMHKSTGNGIDPADIIKDYGADILRLWVASSDYHADIRLSQEILKQLSEAYRKIRNTARFILGNLFDFDPDADRVAPENLTQFDRWAMGRLDSVIEKAKAGYDAMDFHVAFHAILNFCTVDLSNFYLDVLKDRLYCEKKGSTLRRAAQTVLYDALTAFTRLAAPILPFTAEEIWQHVPASKSLDMRSVFYNDMPAQSGVKPDSEALWGTIVSLRADVQKALELKRTAKEIGKSLEAKVTLSCSDSLYEALAPAAGMLADLFIVSQVELEKGAAGEMAGETEGLFVTVSRADGEKCERCWRFDGTVGHNADHPALCARCAAAVAD
ncbi:MAG: isoleucine--tRNA ligase [Oscillospiraceae bacterium]|jgi:isoleucyl-tRNA synthetase|nr:isoleucine--tRNA ligase [Oscillospiraceae bacterium]